MSWLVAAMAAGVLEGDMLTGIDCRRVLVTRDSEGATLQKDGSREAQF